MQQLFVRYLQNCKLPAGYREIGPLTSEEIVKAQHRLIMSAQNLCFGEEIEALKSDKPIPMGSKLQPLNPILDTDGILRCDGRLKYECIACETRYPIILPKTQHITKLIIKNAHQLALHSGTNYVLSQLSGKYWILSEREAIRGWERECNECKRRNAKPVQPKMAPLPKYRLGGSLRAFTHISVDFGGPIITVQGRGRARVKRYLCLFTCLEVRAVHLEMTWSLHTESFLNAFFSNGIKKRYARKRVI
ncbi:uncharacterized protein LOC117106725 [Anneissia japonica]|uniref:uncharacterized protein LOC117106725 n=1 Tax=Anneissia japonica TaxID=1529436 RepID=UPI001425A885|nr:uncharacterized protein LOC117106725 [Anneissia japonica]